MSESDRGQPVVVSCGPCRCPGTVRHHDGDTVTMRPKLSTAMGVAGYAVLRTAQEQKLSLAVTQGALADVWLTLGIVDWTFLDAKNEPEQITPESIERLIPWGNGGLEVANKGDELYAADLFHPLGKRPSTSSPAMPTETSTSASLPSGPSHPTPSKRSSPDGTAGKLSVVPA